MKRSRYLILLTGMLLSLYGAIFLHQVFSKDDEGRSDHSAGSTAQPQFPDDWEWVLSQNDLSFHRRFIERYPEHEKTDVIRKRIIDSEVRKIALGNHVDMPKIKRISSTGDLADFTIENKTGCDLKIRYSGDESYFILIPQDSTGTFSIEPGEYQIAATLSGAMLPKHYGRETIGAGTYSSVFYISIRYR